MLKTISGDIAIAELREYMAEQNLTPPLPPRLELTQERAERVYQLATTSVALRSQHSTRKAQYVLAACLAVALGIGLGVRFWPGGLNGSSSGATPEPTSTVVAGIPPLRFEADLTNLAAAPSAEQALEAARRTAAAAGHIGDGDIQFVSMIEHFVEVEVNEQGIVSGFQIGLVRNEHWLEPDGAAIALETRGPMVDISRVSELNFAGDIVGETVESIIPAPSTERLRQSGELPYTPWIIAELPRDPKQLRPALLQRGNCGNTDQCLAFSITALYRYYVIPDDLAAAMWATIADSPTLRDLGKTTDRLGRPVLAFAQEAYPDDPEDNFFVYLVSAETGRLIGWEEVAVNDRVHNIDEPTVIAFTIWVQSRFVENVGDGASADRSGNVRDLRG